MNDIFHNPVVNKIFLENVFAAFEIVHTFIELYVQYIPALYVKF